MLIHYHQTFYHMSEWRHTGATDAYNSICKCNRLHYIGNWTLWHHDVTATASVSAASTIQTCTHSLLASIVRRSGRNDVRWDRGCWYTTDWQLWTDVPTCYHWDTTDIATPAVSAWAPAHHFDLIDAIVRTCAALGATSLCEQCS